MQFALPNNPEIRTQDSAPFRAQMQQINHRFIHTVPFSQHRQPGSCLAAAIGAHATLVARASLAVTGGAAYPSLERHWIVECAIRENCDEVICLSCESYKNCRHARLLFWERLPVMGETGRRDLRLLPLDLLLAKRRR